METSFDDSNNEYMSLSEADAFDFDQVKTTYLNSLGKSEDCAKSVDALIEDDSSFAFIEFKNCQITDRIRIVSSIMEKAQEELIRFGFDRHKGSYMKDVHTYTEKQFAEYMLRRSSNQDQPLPNMV